MAEDKANDASLPRAFQDDVLNALAVGTMVPL